MIRTYFLSCIQNLYRTNVIKFLKKFWIHTYVHMLGVPDNARS